MKLKFFAVPALAPDETAETVNQFLGSHRVVSMDRELVHQDGAAYWALCVSYLDGDGAPAPTKRGKVDYKELLSAQDFAVFVQLRNLRKDISQQEGVPPYALFTNEQLAALVTQRVRTLKELEDIPGVGPARVKKYGQAFLEALRQGTVSKDESNE